MLDKPQEVMVGSGPSRQHNVVNKTSDQELEVNSNNET